MELGLKGKVAVITGGTQGIGRAAAIMLAHEGVKVAVCARGKERLDELAAEVKAVGGELLAVQADVNQERDLERFVQAAVDRWQRLDILVNNAGAGAASAFDTVDDAAWQQDIDLKLFGAIRMTRLAIPLMKKQGGGRIINITTIGGKQPHARSLPTTVTRAAGLALTKELSKELAADNILVNTICIGKIKSGQHERTAQRKGTALDAHYVAMSADIPMARVGEAEEVASVIAFLASNAASYVTGTSINLDGGMSGVL